MESSHLLFSSRMPLLKAPQPSLSGFSHDRPPCLVAWPSQRTRVFPACGCWPPRAGPEPHAWGCLAGWDNSLPPQGFSWPRNGQIVASGTAGSAEKDWCGSKETKWLGQGSPQGLLGGGGLAAGLTFQGSESGHTNPSLCSPTMVSEPDGTNCIPAPSLLGLCPKRLPRCSMPSLPS